MEFVYVVPRSDLFPAAYPHGFVAFGSQAERELRLERLPDTLATRGFFVERARAEVEPAWKQPIPYAIVHGRQGVLCLRRKRAGSETRLHDKLSIGVGGHVEPVDLADPSRPTERRELIARAAVRELEEELVLPNARKGEQREVRQVGVLNDDSNSVGAVHVGLVCVLDLSHAESDHDVCVREADLLEGEFVSPEELERRLACGANFETWSALLIPHLPALLQRAPLALKSTAVPG